MKTVLSVLTTVVLSCSLIGLAVAQQRSPKDTTSPPKGVEGPEIRKQERKGTGGVETPKTGKKSPRARDQKPKDTPYPPSGVEGPETRKQTPKGTGGVDAPTPAKKGTRAKGQQPKRTDSPPKVTAEPGAKQDGGEKTQ